MNITERALCGRAVVLRCGLKGYVRYIEKEIETEQPAIGYIVRPDGSIAPATWALDGSYLAAGVTSRNDIIGLAPLEFKYWHLLRDEVKYIAKDEDGEWWGFAFKPIICDKVGESTVWITVSANHRQYDLEALVLNLFPECDWQDSLIERPENDL